MTGDVGRGQQGAGNDVNSIVFEAGLPQREKQIDKKIYNPVPIHPLSNMASGKSQMIAVDAVTSSLRVKG